LLGEAGSFYAHLLVLSGIPLDPVADGKTLISLAAPSALASRLLVLMAISCSRASVRWVLGTVWR
jgi:hypothetical protein